MQNSLKCLTNPEREGSHSFCSQEKYFSYFLVQCIKVTLVFVVTYLVHHSFALTVEQRLAFSSSPSSHLSHLNARITQPTFYYIKFVFGVHICIKLQVLEEGKISGHEISR